MLSFLFGLFCGGSFFSDKFQTCPTKTLPLFQARSFSVIIIELNFYSLFSLFAFLCLFLIIPGILLLEYYLLNSNINPGGRNLCLESVHSHPTHSV